MLCSQATTGIHATSTVCSAYEEWAKDQVSAGRDPRLHGVLIYGEAMHAHTARPKVTRRFFDAANDQEIAWVLLIAVVF